MDPTLLKALIGSGIFVAVSAIGVALLKLPTELWAARSAARKVKLDIEEAERKEAAARRQEGKADLEDCWKRCDHLQEQLDKVRAERDTAIDERNAARRNATDNERLLAMRLFECERVGKPCQTLPMAQEERKAA